MAGDPGPFGRKLKELRESAALSQEELAERANLTAKAIGALERGERRRPYPNTIRALCDGLGLDDITARALAEVARPKASGASTPTAVTAIPHPPTRLVGRHGEVARVSELLDLPSTRLVTLSGPGGVGKTRLALEVAHRSEALGREVVLVELAGIRRTDLVLPAIARAFGLTAGSDDIAGWIAASTVDRAPLLVLDNVEHLLAAASEIADLLERCASVVVLATSRAPLRIRAEHDVPIDPLTLPAADGVVDAVVASPAVQMFADRARSVLPGFSVDLSNAAPVAAICRRLDGLPLALELAAVHVRYLPPPQLLERLGHAVDSARLRDLPERQRTLSATLDWSRDLLTEDEQTVLGAVSVFAGGFDLPAAEQVAGTSGRDVSSAIEGLVEQSLVLRADPSELVGAHRLRMLESVRGYAAASLDDEHRAEFASRHAAYFVDLAATARDGLRSAELPLWLDRLDAEHANLGAALTTALERGQFDAAARLGADTWLYWTLRGRAGEGLIWWERVLEEGGGSGLGDAGQAAAHLALAGLRFATGDIGRARQHAAAATAAARTGGERGALTEALVLSCMSAAFQGDLPGANEQLMELGPHQDDPWERALVLIARAQVALLGGRLDDCGAALDAAEELGRGAAGQFVLGTTLNIRTTLALHADDDAAALRSASESIALAATVRTTWTLLYTLSALAALAVRAGRPDLAAGLFGLAAATAERSLVAVAFAPDVESADVHLSRVRQELSAEEFDECFERGREMEADEVLDLIGEISARCAPS